MRCVPNLIVLLLIGLMAHAESNSPPVIPSIEQAKAALALAKAKRTREAEQARVKAEKCFDNFADANEFALKTGKPLVLWVGMKCEESPDVRKQLPDVVHCHLNGYGGSDVARVVFTDKDSKPHSIHRENLNQSAGMVIRQLVGLPEKPKDK